MQAKIAPWAFVLAVPNLDRSAVYFRDVLGFMVRWEDVTGWRLMERDTVRVMLGECPNDMRPAEITARGATCSAPADRPYGMREIVVTTVDGHRIVFGQESATPTSD